MGYSIDRTISDRGFDEVVLAAREALKAEGSGVLTEIDVQATKAGGGSAALPQCPDHVAPGHQRREGAGAGRLARQPPL